MSADLQERATRAHTALCMKWEIEDSGSYWVARTKVEFDGRGYEIDKHLAPDEDRAWIALEVFETIYQNGVMRGMTIGSDQREVEHRAELRAFQRVLGIDRICDEIRRAGEAAEDY